MTRRRDGRPKVILDEVIENAPAAIYVKDPTGRFLFFNRQAEVISGISSEEALGRTDFDLFPPAVAEMYRREDLQTLERMSPLQFEEPLLVDGSERIFLTVKFPVLDEEEVLGVCGLSIDITDEPNQGQGTAAEQSRADAFFGRLLASLTPQEVRVLDLVATGLSDREIAEKLHLSRDTVRHHVSHLLRKLRKRRAQVIIEMLKRGRA